MGDPLESWEAQLRTYDLPEWDNLPELELYMDQVVLLLSRYLAFFSQGEEEKIITPSIVNNYVRMKVMPAPAKKRYGRIHIAYLLMICTLKQSLSIAAIQKLLPWSWTRSRCAPSIPASWRCTGPLPPTSPTSSRSPAPADRWRTSPPAWQFSPASPSP